MTYSVLIGNSDNKLTQEEWANFVADLNIIISDLNEAHLHFAGGTDSHSIYQSFCMVFELDDELEEFQLRTELEKLKRNYKQDSIALVEGITKFI